MIKLPRYFINKIQIDTIEPGTRWVLNDKYIKPLDESSILLVYFETHEYWFTEVPPQVNPKNT
jgi:hypothetical protein